MEDGVLAPLGSDGLHHVGATVADLDRSLAFWEPFLGRARRFKTVLERPYLGQVLGMPGHQDRRRVRRPARRRDPGAARLPAPDRVPHTDDTRHPATSTCASASRTPTRRGRAPSACGARPVNPDGPVELDGGPNKGAKVGLPARPDGISIELFQLPPHLVERRYERLPAATLERLREEAPLAYVPIGPLEHHGPHLPMGVDGFSAHELSLRAARTSGGVVLPATYLATGCLDLPGTLTFSNELVARFAEETIQQLYKRGFRAVVLLSGHGPMDLHPPAQAGRPGAGGGAARPAHLRPALAGARGGHARGPGGRAPRPGRPRGRGRDVVDARDPARVRPHGAPAGGPRRPAPARRLRRRPARRLGRDRHGAPGGRRRAAGRAGLAPRGRRGGRRARRLPALRRPLLARAAAAGRPRRATPTTPRCWWPTRARRRAC